MRAVLVLLLAGLLLCSCTEHGQQPRTSFQDYPAAVKEYLDAEGRLDLPSGKSWPASPIPHNDSEREEYERFAGTALAELFYFCAWADTYRVTGGSIEAATRISQIKGMDVYRNRSDAETKRLFGVAAAAASRGDSAGVLDSTHQLCG